MFHYPERFDVIVVGAGHAGVEAASASLRLGLRVLLLTQNLDTITQMSCNPAMGGLAKGHMIREIDALGGLMALNTDATGIQFRMLNARKGPSVQAPRAQCDKKAYQFRMKAHLEGEPNLSIKQGNVQRLVLEGDHVAGIETHLGERFSGRSVIITTGTFLRGLLHVGKNSTPGGRMGDGTSSLSDHLREIGFEVGRFKTGTPCRINGKSINFDACERQPGDEPPPQFSFLPEWIERERGLFTLNHYRDGVFHVEQLPCWITYTNSRTHDVIRANLDKSPLYSGIIQGIGPRYCPSIEDKVVRFAEKERHQIFLEPEGKHTHEFYVNGLSTSLPHEVQHAVIRSIPGLEYAEIMRPGYAVEYDYCPPTQLHPTLETRRIEHLYFAGQINGTSGYEEAGAQGLIAGANAGLKLLGKPPLILGRDEAYIGVLIDDLITLGIQEPYRMFTSRAEYRLLLRHDTADLRLTPRAHALGLVNSERSEHTASRQKGLADLQAFTDATRFEGIPLSLWLRRPDNHPDQLPESIRTQAPETIWSLLETNLKYEGYIQRQATAVERSRRQEGKTIPAWVDYDRINGLRIEARQKLSATRPATLGQAGRLSGVTPADVALLTVWIEKPTRSDPAADTGDSIIDSNQFG